MSRPGARVAVLAGILLPVLTLTSCTSVRNVLGTHVSACFRVLPTASQAVDAKGAYQGVRYVPPDGLLSGIQHERTGTPTTPVPPALRAAAHESVCLVEYKGTYSVASVTAGWSPAGDAADPYAVVVVRQSDDVVLATVLLRKEPMRFSRNYPT
jgi:hypothetical protein